MKKTHFFALFLLFFIPSILMAQEPKEMIFGNIKVTGEDSVTGYRLSLLDQGGNKYTGSLSVFQSAPEPVQVKLDSVTYETKATTGGLKFTGSFESGTHYCPTHNGVPNKESLSFVGDWSWTTIKGTLTRQSLLHSDQKIVEQITLEEEK